MEPIQDYLKCAEYTLCMQVIAYLDTGKPQLSSPVHLLQNLKAKLAASLTPVTCHLCPAALLKQPVSVHTH